MTPLGAARPLASRAQPPRYLLPVTLGCFHRLSHIIAPPGGHGHDQEGQWGFGLLLRALHNLPEFPKCSAVRLCGKSCKQSSAWCWQQSCCLTRPPGMSRAAAACHLYGGILGVTRILVCQHGCTEGTGSAPAAGAQRGGTRSGWGCWGAALGCSGDIGALCPVAVPAGGGLSAARCAVFGTG